MTTAASARPTRSEGQPRESLGSRARRVAVVAAMVALLATVLAYAHSMTSASNTALGVRSVEWLRDNGAAGIVAQVETWYYSLSAPSKGGPTRLGTHTPSPGSAGRISGAMRAGRTTAGAVVFACVRWPCVVAGVAGVVAVATPTFGSALRVGPPLLGAVRL